MGLFWKKEHRLSGASVPLNTSQSQLEVGLGSHYSTSRQASALIWPLDVTFIFLADFIPPLLRWRSNFVSTSLFFSRRFFSLCDQLLSEENWRFTIKDKFFSAPILNSNIHFRRLNRNV